MSELRKITSMTLAAKAGNNAAEAMCGTVQAWLKQRQITTRVLRHPDDDILKEAGETGDLILVFGGDGTMVSIARRMLGKGIPIAGVNFGKVGFLTELETSSWEAALTDVLANGLKVESRMSLFFTLIRKGETLLQGNVVNDVVVTRGKVARLVNLLLGVNGASFISLRSDGLIISTPTGASGYACSAGGPLLLPTLNAYVVAAICPFLSSFPPMVLRPENIFTVTVGEAASDLYLTLDGQEAHELNEGDILQVRGFPEALQIADFGLKSYFDRLLRAGFVQERNSVSES